ncbi:hypothetical protein ACEWY4_024721 [Coilia grayii]|uniref:G-protein coupled receptors family 1 profile domain-containing protein n=1 Tax=Coilia grayii TaxID=363190 RepID=A0ABD1IVJ9_9TELE
MEDYDGRIRFYMFNLFGLIGGVAALVWAARTLHLYRRFRGKDSVFIITLLFIDALELLAVCALPFLYELSIMACFVLRLLSLCLHQLVALEGVASVTHPRFAAIFSSVPCSVPLTFITFILVGFVVVNSSFHLELQCLSFFIVTAVVPVLIQVVMCILICTKAKPHQASGRGISEKTVLVESLVSYLILHGPCLLVVTMYLLNPFGPPIFVWFLVGHIAALSTMCSSISSLWVMADCLLCVMVCRLPRMQFP